MMLAAESPLARASRRRDSACRVRCAVAAPRGDTRGAVLVLEDVLLSVGPSDLLDGSASLRLEPGETIGLVGNNGCGCVADRALSTAVS